LFSLESVGAESKRNDQGKRPHDRHQAQADRRREEDSCGPPGALVMELLRQNDALPWKQVLALEVSWKLASRPPDRVDLQIEGEASDHTDAIRKGEVVVEKIGAQTLLKDTG
jgi:hypothetical protein